MIYIFLLLLPKPNIFQGYKSFQNFLVWYRYVGKWFVFKQEVLRINASAFKNQLLDFIRVECIVDKRSTASTPHFK